MLVVPHHIKYPISPISGPKKTRPNTKPVFLGGWKGLRTIRVLGYSMQGKKCLADWWASGLYCLTWQLGQPSQWVVQRIHFNILNACRKQTEFVKPGWYMQNGTLNLDNLKDDDEPWDSGYLTTRDNATWVSYKITGLPTAQYSYHKRLERPLNKSVWWTPSQGLTLGNN